MDAKPAGRCIFCGLEIVLEDSVLGGWHLHRHTGTRWCQPGPGRPHFTYQATPKRPPSDSNYRHRKETR